MESVGNLNTEMTLLAWSVLLYIVQLFMGSITQTNELGWDYGFSPRDEKRAPKNVYVGRILRAFGNLRETYVLFVTLALALTVTDRADGVSAVGAHLWFWSRVVYVPIYYFGIPIVRTGLFFLSIAGIFLMLYAFLF